MEPEEIPPDASHLYEALLTLAEVEALCFEMQRRLCALPKSHVVAVDSLVEKTARGMWTVYEIADTLKNETNRLFDLRFKFDTALGIGKERQPRKR